MVIFDESDYLAHYGIIRRSGRYPWGSTNNEGTPWNDTPQRNPSFLDYVKELRRAGLSDAEIARGLGISTTELRARRTILVNEDRQAKINQVQKLKDRGWSNVAIADRLGLPESTVRSYLAPGAKDKVDVLITTANMLENQVKEKGLIDIGTGVENYIGVSATKLNAAVAILKEKGYTVHTIPVKQPGTGHETKQKVLAPPDTTWGEVVKNKKDIRFINNFSEDGGRSFLGIQEPLSLSSDRVQIKYKEDGGDKEDGVIYIRPGVEDISLGASNYAQVRVAVDDTHYLKGMAIYKDDLPSGVDVLFNTNKSDTGNKLDAMKPLSDDIDNPFGALIKRQITIKDVDGKDKVVSTMNIVNEEGDWGNWSKSIASQVLSKQSPSLAKQQLKLTYDKRKADLDEILSITNPTVKRHLLREFADEADLTAVNLKAHHLPRQAWQVILPVNTIPPTQVYAPNFRDGETVVLIRYPHGGTFEIPELKVNNSHPEAKRLLGPKAKDAIGIHHSVAERLSGADFDGDTVLVIPNNTGTGRIKSTGALEGLKNFDPRASYPAYPGMKKISPSHMQNEMGVVSNLITDMTIKKAPADHIARAVRHSMVIIDSEKHNLDYKQSYKDNGIAQLKARYQSDPDRPGKAGASTLISRAESSVFIPKRTERPARDGGPINRKTGEREYIPTGETKLDKSGKVVPRLQKSEMLRETKDAHTLSSGTPIERVYADHSNALKQLANTARLELVNTPRLSYSPTARRTYSNEVASLDSKLNLIQRNRPLERQALLIANTTIRAKRDANPNMSEDTRKKIERQAITEARRRTGAQRHNIKITPREWEAIQAGAISDSKLSQILLRADEGVVRSLAVPKADVLMTQAKTETARSMAAAGYTRAQIADRLGVSISTLDRAIHEREY